MIQMDLEGHQTLAEDVRRAIRCWDEARRAEPQQRDLIHTIGHHLELLRVMAAQVGRWDLVSWLTQTIGVHLPDGVTGEVFPGCIFTCARSAECEHGCAGYARRAPEAEAEREQTPAPPDPEESQE